MLMGLFPRWTPQLRLLLLLLLPHPRALREQTVVMSRPWS
jgi:hypothetical protein